MKLHSSPTSPFARKVRALIVETGQSGEIEIVDTVGHALDPGTHPTALNPSSKIPVLERADGPAIYDSRVICRFLDDRAGGGLYPEKRIWETLTLEATADGIMDAAVLMVYEGRVRPEDKQFPDYVEAQWAKVTRALDALESRWLSHLAGPLDMGHIAVGCALGYLDFRHPDRDWRHGYTGLTKWDAACRDRPSMQATVPH